MRQRIHLVILAGVLGIAALLSMEGRAVAACPNSTVACSTLQGKACSTNGSCVSCYSPVLPERGSCHCVTGRWFCEW